VKIERQTLAAGRTAFNYFAEQRQAQRRLLILLGLALVIFLVLAARLWWLQVLNHKSFAEQAKQNRTRVLAIPASRGKIYDRNGKPLVESRPAYNIIVSRRDMRSVAEETETLVNHLGIDRAWLARRFEEAKYEPKYESLVVKEMASPADVAWVLARQYEYPQLRVEAVPQRYYPHGSFAAHVLGYVGEVSPRELQAGQFSRAQGYKMGDIIGKTGVERVYNDVLMGKQGARIVVVDSRGRIQYELDRIEPVPGRDLHTTLDFDLQQTAEQQGDSMPKGRGAIAVMDPRNGEMLSLVSRPTFDPNLFSQRVKSPEDRSEIRDIYQDEDRPLYNRVVQGTYPTGSTWKIFMAVAALNEGVITVEDSRIQDGGLQIGNYFMRSLSHLGRPDIHLAIVKSADGYFYRLGLKMGIELIEKWTDIFRLGQRTGIDLPNERAGIPPSREWKAKVNPRDPRWRDYDTAAASIGQGIAITPLQMLRMVAGVSVSGRMPTPHFLLKAAAGYDRAGNWQDELRYADKDAFTVPMSPQIHQTVTRAMWGVVNENGTGGRARVEGFDVAGKTGTAQVASARRAGEQTKDHAWFVGFAPWDKPEIAAVVLTENAGFGGTHSAPKAQAIYEAYYQRTRGQKEAPPVAGGL
jgi:penicillin-binding protein 2